MIVAAYMPSWEGAAWALPGQCMVVGALAAALFFYARSGMARRGPLSLWRWVRSSG